MPLRNIVCTLGGDLYAGGRRANVPYPGHSRADRSLSLLVDHGKVVVSCFGAGDWREALEHLRSVGLIDRDNRPTGTAAAMLAPLPMISSRERCGDGRAHLGGRSRHWRNPRANPPAPAPHPWRSSGASRGAV